MGQIANGQLCPKLLALAALIGGALALRAASGRRLGARAVDGALAAGLRLLGAKDGFIPII